jgi:hypothetical protein
MNNYKSVQDLIVKAAIYDRVSTTISVDEAVGGVDVLKIKFSKGDRYGVTYIDLLPTPDHEAMTLHCCKSALRELFWEPYRDIQYTRGE